MGLKPGQWAETEHQCRFCMAGRVMRGKEERDVKNDNGEVERREVPVYQCFSCGATGGTHQAVCGCGAKWPNGRLRGFRCVPNPDPSPGIPWLYGFEEMEGFADPLG